MKEKSRYNYPLALIKNPDNQTKLMPAVVTQTEGVIRVMRTGEYAPFVGKHIRCTRQLKPGENVVNYLSEPITDVIDPLL